MKIVRKSMGKAAENSSAEGTAFRELRYLLLATCLLAVGIYVAIGLLVDAGVSAISVEREGRIFGSLDWAVGKEDDPRLERARDILAKLTSDATVPALDYRLALIPGGHVNAFAFPGGTIGVTGGLLESVTGDMALAFVLAHELGHFRHRDHLRGFGRAAGVSVAYGIVFGGQMGSDTMSRTMRFVLERGYSRGQEEQADRFGVELVHRVYGETEGVDALFRLIQVDDDLPDWAYMFATHPKPQDRINALQEHAEKLQ